jgi:hypothetical protein
MRPHEPHFKTVPIREEKPRRYRFEFEKMKTRGSEKNEKARISAKKQEKKSLRHHHGDTQIARKTGKAFQQKKIKQLFVVTKIFYVKSLQLFLKPGNNI